MGRIIDFHSHILPEMDDGSRDPEMSARMLQALFNQGVEIVCATPHFYREENAVPEFLERRQRAWDAMPQPANMPQVLLGAEVAYYPGMSESENLESLCLQGTKALLLEMPFCAWTGRQILEVVRLIIDRDFFIVLAHPERYLFEKCNRDAINRFAEMDTGMQVNASTLCHWQTRDVGLKLLQSTGAPFLGTDCHNLDSRAPQMQRARKAIGRRLGAEFLAELDESVSQILEPDSGEIPERADSGL